MFFEELPGLLERCIHDDCFLITGDFNIHYDNINDSLTKQFCELVDTFSAVQTVDFPTHEDGHTIDLVLHRDSDNLVLSTRPCHDLTSDHTSVLCSLAARKPTMSVKHEAARFIGKINVGDFAVDIADGLSPNMSLSNLNQHPRSVLDKHAPLCQRKVRQRKPTP